VGTRVAEYGLTVPQFGVLEALHHVGPMSLGELADRLLVTGGNITYVMDKLEDQGLVHRRRSERDRRVVEAHLSCAGRELIQGVFPGHAAHVRAMVAHLSDGEVGELRTLLKKLGKGIAAREEAS
jgi:MarR family transcriptional regulator, 2-MHQ and catechol-resistance regulon repressor